MVTFDLGVLCKHPAVMVLEKALLLLHYFTKISIVLGPWGPCPSALVAF